MKVAALVGPTAVGKTRISVEVARRLGGEIVSLDSMQVYKRMDVGTDKATPAQRASVPHHLVDVFEPSEEVSVSRYRDLARSAIEEISGRGRIPLLVGGSGLYLRAVVDDLRLPPTAAPVRRALEERLRHEGAAALHAELEAKDPQAASRIDPRNFRRTVRALEVIEITGLPFSAEARWKDYDSIYDLAVAGLTRERGLLYRAIEERVRDMIQHGLVSEVDALAALGLSRTARQALGYRQVLDATDRSPEALVTAIATATKRFARRQLSWFKADPRVRWFDAADPDVHDVVAAYLATALQVTLRT